MELTIAEPKPLLPGLESALHNDEVSELMINEAGTIFVERRGRMAALEAPELIAEAVARAAIQITRPLGEDPKTDSIIDVRLTGRIARGGLRPARGAGDGHHHSPPWQSGLHHRGADRVRFDVEAGGRASALLRSGRGALISGGAGFGKTTLLNALLSLLPVEGRVISIEDTLVLRLRQSNCLRFEARGLAGRDVMIRDLAHHALRHRPDHIVVGEVRGAEAPQRPKTSSRLGLAICGRCRAQLAGVGRPRARRGSDPRPLASASIAWPPTASTIASRPTASCRPSGVQFPSQDAYTHTALHEPGTPRATEHPGTPTRARKHRHPDLRLQGAAGGDRRDDDRRAPRRRARAAAIAVVADS